MKNLDKSYNYEDLNKDMLKQFSEGSNSLEELLNNCYDNKIVTRGCCVGHDIEGENPWPYISFVIPKEQVEFIDGLVEYYYNNNENNNIIEIEKEENNLIISVHNITKDENNKEIFFKDINNTVNKFINKETNSKYEQTGNIMYDLLNSNDEVQGIRINNNGISAYKEEKRFFIMKGEEVIWVNEDELGNHDNVYNTFVDTNIIEASSLEEFMDYCTKNKNKSYGD